MFYTFNPATIITNIPVIQIIEFIYNKKKKKKFETNMIRLSKCLVFIKNCFVSFEALFADLLKFCWFQRKKTHHFTWANSVGKINLFVYCLTFQLNWFAHIKCLLNNSINKSFKSSLVYRHKWRDSFRQRIIFHTDNFYDHESDHKIYSC